MNSPRLSLVLPVFNVAPYLPRCLDSLIALNPEADEIIVVDDGSTDDCSAILANYAARLPQMRVIRQENSGLSVARNTGIEAATGHYLAFVDSDDFLAPDAYAQGLKAMEHDNLDMALLNGSYHFEGRKTDYAIYADVPATEVIPGSEWLRQRLRAGQFLHMVWLHIYRRDFIESHNFRFLPRLIHEDVIWTTRLLLAAERVRYIPIIAVHYRIPIRRFSAEQKQRRLEAIIASSVTNARVEAEIAANLVDIELRYLMRRRLVDGALSIFHKLSQMPDQSAAVSTLNFLRREGFIIFLWKQAQSIRQYRKILKRWLQSLLLSWFNK